METSPSRHIPHLPPPSTTVNPTSSSPRSTRTLRKLQSAQALSSSYAAANAPGLISQQRQLQHRSSGLLREPSATQTILPPPIQSHGRSRSNSDIVATGIAPAAPGPRRIPKKANSGADANPKDDLETVVRQGTKGDAMGSLDKLRRLVLLDGVDADSDGMVSILLEILAFTYFQLMKTTTVSFANLHLVNPPQRSTAFNRYLPFSHTPRPLPSLLQNPQRHLPHTSHRPPFQTPRQRSLPHPTTQRSSLETARCQTTSILPTYF